MKRKIMSALLALILILPFVLAGCNADERTIEYTVVFNKNTTDNVAFLPETIIVEKGGKVQRPIRIPARIGYTFVDWFTKASNGNEYNFSSSVNESITLYAYWQENIEEIIPLSERQTIDTIQNINQEFYEADEWDFLKDDSGQDATTLSDNSIRFFRTNLTTDSFSHDITDGEQQISFMVNGTKDWSIRFGAYGNENSDSAVVLRHELNRLQLGLSGEVYGLSAPDYETGALALESDQASGYIANEWNRIDLVFSNSGLSMNVKLYVNTLKADLKAGETLANISVSDGSLVYRRIDGVQEFGSFVSVKTWARDNVFRLKAVPNADDDQAIEPIRIACIGDSITEGAGAGEFYKDAYPQRLQKKLGNTYSVINFGVSGRTAVNLDESEENVWEGSYRKNIKDEPWQGNVYNGVKLFKPDILIVMLGTNDSKPKYKITNAQFKLALNEIIDGVRAVNPDALVILNTSPTAYENEFEINPEKVSTMACAVQKEIADEKDYKLVDINKYTRNKHRVFFSADGVHPNDSGYEMIAEIMKRVITDTDSSEEELQEVSDSYIEPTPLENITTTNDFNTAFYTPSNWSSKTPLSSGNTLVFKNGTYEYNALAEPVVGEKTQYSFMIKAPESGGANASWEIHFGKIGNSYYSLNQRFDYLYLDANGKWWLSEVKASEAGFVFDEWNRIDIVIDRTENGKTQIAIYVNTVHAFFIDLNAHDVPANISYSQGVLVDTSSTIGNKLVIVASNNDIQIAPTTYEP